jgi:hypothetical protein
MIRKKRAYVDRHVVVKPWGRQKGFKMPLKQRKQIAESNKKKRIKPSVKKE